MSNQDSKHQSYGLPPRFQAFLHNKLKPTSGAFIVALFCGAVAPIALFAGSFTLASIIHGCKVNASGILPWGLVVFVFALGALFTKFVRDITAAQYAMAAIISAIATVVLFALSSVVSLHGMWMWDGWQQACFSTQSNSVCACRALATYHERVPFATGSPCAYRLQGCTTARYSTTLCEQLVETNCTKEVKRLCGTIKAKQCAGKKKDGCQHIQEFCLEHGPGQKGR